MKPGVLFLILQIICSSVKVFSQITIPYSQGFEDPVFLPTDWEFFGSSPSFNWERNDSLGGYGLSTACALFDNFNHTTGGYFGMRAPMMDLTGVTKPMLVFDVAYARYSPAKSDRLGIWYSLNGSTGWVNITNYQDASLTTAPDNTGYFIPDSTEWRTITLDLSAFANFPSIRFAFENNSQNGNVMYLDNVYFFDSATVAVNPIHRDHSADYFVFPNPSSGSIHLVSNQVMAGRARIEMYDLKGHLVYESLCNLQAASGKIEIDPGNIQPGIYHLIIRSESGTAARKLTIVR